MTNQVSPVKNRAFLGLLAFRVQLVLAYQILAVAVGWHLYQITHDPLSLGLIGLAEVLPYFCLAMFAGHAVDHYPKRLCGLVAPIVLTFNAGGLAWLTLTGSPSEMAFWIYVSMVLVGLARAFIAPSYSAIFALLLPREQYAQASGVGSTAFQIGLVSGPALGGLLVGFSGTATAYFTSAILCFGSAIAMLFLRFKEPPAKQSLPVFQSIREGLHFVMNTQVLLAAQALDMFAVLFGGAVSMLPAFIHDVYHLQAESLGLLRSAPAVGAMLTGISLSYFPINRHAGRWLLWAVGGFGVCMIGFALTHDFWSAFIVLAISGGFDGISVVVRSSIMQLSTPDHMRGRVSAINGIFIGSSNELGAFESGLTARLLGLVPSVIFGGMMTLAVVTTTAKLAPKLRQLHLHQLH